MQSFMRRLLALAAMMMAAQAILASDPMPTDCSLKDRSQAVALVVCNPGVQDLVWREAGKAACGGDASCNAWIWDSDSKAPAAAPVSDEALEKEHSGAAVAVWVNESQALITLRRVR